MDIEQILKTLPHRYPFVMVDRVLEIVPGERIVALKTIRADQLAGAEGPNVIARFRREAQAAGRLNHPNIVSIYEFGEDAGTWFIADTTPAPPSAMSTATASHTIADRIRLTACTAGA